MRRLALGLIALTLMTGVTSDRQRAEHALNRLAFGARPGDVERVMNMGVDAWIDQQLHPESIPDNALEARLCKLPTLELTNTDMVDAFYKPIVQARREKDSEAMKMLQQKSRRVVGDLVSQRILRAADSNRQLNEVMVDFWFNHFNVFAGKGIDRFLLTSYERDAIRPHVWGKFEDLLMATAKSPAMLFYLDNARSVADPAHRNPRVQAMLERRRPEMANKGGLNENYAREIMELHTLGVDGGYTQKDVTELARVFTGWSIDRRTGSFIFRPALHDVGAKMVLGVYFPPGGGIEEGERMIHILAHSPATAHHIAFELCQRFVADDPPKALVDRVATTFLASDGDLRATVKAVIDSPEFWDPAVYRGKEKSPFEFVISAVRAVNAGIVNPIPIAQALRQIGEPLYGAQPPTGYSEKSEVWNNSGALMNRINFVVALANNQLPGVRVAVGDPKQTALKLGSPEFQQQ